MNYDLLRLYHLCDHILTVTSLCTSNLAFMETSRTNYANYHRLQSRHGTHIACRNPLRRLKIDNIGICINTFSNYNSYIYWVETGMLPP